MVPVNHDDVMTSPHPKTIKLNKSFCGGPGGGFLEKSPLAAGGKSNFKVNVVLIIQTAGW
jgi:hypothetical protein